MSQLTPIVQCMRTVAKEGVLTDDGRSPSQPRGVRGHAPPGNFCIFLLHLPRSILVHSDSILAHKYRYLLGERSEPHTGVFNRDFA